MDGIGAKRELHFHLIEKKQTIPVQEINETAQG